MAKTSPCAFCGHPDAQHRVREAILDRFLAGESLDYLAWDYGVAGTKEPLDGIEAWLRRAMRERLGWEDGCSVEEMQP